MDIIQQLKDNNYAFGLWPEMYENGKEMQERAREIGLTEFECYGVHDITKWTRLTVDVGVFEENRTYRLRPDYKEDEVVERCKIYQGDGLEFRDSTGKSNSITTAQDYPDFIGIKAGGHLWGMFKCKDTGIMHSWILEGSLANYEVLTPTYVLFKN